MVEDARVISWARVAATGILVLFATAAAAGAARAAEPPGPRLLTTALAEFGPPSSSPPPPLISLETISPAGGAPEVLVEGKLSTKSFAPNPLVQASWSGDGMTVAFAGGEEKQARLYVVSTTGERPRPVRGTREGFDPVLSPDGGTIAFTRTRTRYRVDKSLESLLPDGAPLPKTKLVYSSTSVWLVDSSGGHPHRLTPWRDGLEETPTSFSPDGATLALTKRAKSQVGPAVVLADLASGSQVQVAAKAEEAAISPDGTEIVFVGYANPDLVEADENHRYLAPDLYAMKIGGEKARRLTRSRGVIESAPSWDPTGSRVAYVSARAGVGFLPELENLFPTGNEIMQVNADGSCRERVASRPGVALYGAAWQPGPGREAGPIAC
jgi:Tol biopolymer transport system component